MRFAKPLDTDMVITMANEHNVIVTVEENVLQGGAGSAVNEVLLQQATDNRIINLAIRDAFIDHGDHEQQLAECGLDAAGILAAIADACDDSILPSPATKTQSGKQLNG
jgi:1-deoxy-D-xylulose-5-phosphate synthase